MSNAGAAEVLVEVKHIRKRKKNNDIEFRNFSSDRPDRSQPAARLHPDAALLGVAVLRRQLRDLLGGGSPLRVAAL